jgi:hypothetical protein
MSLRDPGRLRFAFTLGAAWLAAVICGCGGTPDGKPVVIVEAGDADVDAGGTIEQIVHEDAGRAAEELEAAIRSGKGRVASWAAVYVLRLGIKHDLAKTRAALTRGASDTDPLLAALCWRWLAADPETQLPKWRKGQQPDDPVIGALAAVAFGRRGKLPKALRDALGPPAGELSGERSEPDGRVEQLTYLAGPFDNGPLALAVSFVDARREAWVEAGPGGRRWVAERLREELYQALVAEGDLPTALRESRPPPDPSYSALVERLDTPLASRPPEVLRGAVLAGEGSLRIGAIRALAVAAVEPAAGDFGAVAAALRSPDPLVRVEAARTYLLLAALATDLD